MDLHSVCHDAIFAQTDIPVDQIHKLNSSVSLPEAATLYQVAKEQNVGLV